MQILFFLFLNLLPPQQLTLKSPAFANRHYIQPKYTCMGENMSPPLTIEGIPKETKSLALIMIDNDTSIGSFDHWVTWNIPPVGKIDENSSPGINGLNGRNENQYTGPCPPNGIHEYHFTVYALNTTLDLPKSTRRQDLLNAMQGHIISTASYVGLFTKAMNHLDK
jgi:Raf kinase inhibitor-like YbhB/YbcL family protein